MTTWLTTVAPRSASESTIDSTYRPKVERWIVPHLGKHRLDRLRPEHLDAFYLALAANGLAPNTVLQIHRILSRALKIAVRREIVSRNVATLVDAPSGNEAEIEPLTQAEARALLKVARCWRGGTRWSVALALGLRQCEALGLRWKYVDLDKGEARVHWQIKRRRYKHGCDDPRACGTVTGYHRSKCPDGCARHARYCPKRTGGGWYFAEPKGKGKRTVVIPPPLVKQLRQQRAALAAERLAAGDSWQDWDLVWCQSDGSPIGAKADWQEWKQLLKAAKVAKDARVHDARHTAATLLLEQGSDLRVVQQVLGHSQITTTRRYAHVTDKLARDAARRMGEALWG
jgi:integrase